MHRGFLLKYLISACLIAAALCAQAPIQPDLEKLNYPALARAARIQGRVKFTIEHGDITLVSGHPILVQAAKDNLQTWAPSQSLDAELEVSYIFRLRPKGRSSRRSASATR
jgi:outer membrane biosynthesis protein TonB